MSQQDANSPESPATSRRDFFTRSAQAAAFLGTGAAGLGAARAASAPPSPATRAEQNTFASGVTQPRDIATGPGDRIYLAADRAVTVFSADGKKERSIALDAPPQCLALDARGNLFVGFRDHIDVLDAQDRRQSSWPAIGKKASLTSLSITPGGEVFAADSGNGVVWRFDGAGHVLDKIARGDGAFSTPTNFFPIAVDHAGRLTTVDVGRHRVETYSPSGEPLYAWGERSRSLEGFGGCCNPVAFAHTRSGQIVTAEAGLPRIKVFDANGTFRELVAGPEAFETNSRESRERPEQPAACHTGGFELAVDSRDRILVLDRVTGEVRIFA